MSQVCCKLHTSLIVCLCCNCFMHLFMQQSLNVARRRLDVTRGMCFEAERRPRDYSGKREIGMEVL